MSRRCSCVFFVLMLTAVSMAVGQTDPNRINLTIGKGPGVDLELDWQDACPQAGTDYGIYGGDLGVYTTHTSIQCGTSGANTMTVTPPSGSAYYLVVPIEEGTEGSYGLDSSGSERPAGLAACSAQQIVNACLEDNFVDASPERLARLDAVLNATALIIEADGSYTDVANMLAGESDVTGVSSNGVSMYFTVGGLSTTIYDTVAARFGGPLNDIIPPANPPPASINALASNLISADAVQPLLPRGQRMVGKDDDGDGFRDLPKHALILSPWAFQFNPNDSAPVVNTILNGVRDYQEGSVIFKANNTDLIQDTMLISDYTGWEDKDIIFLSSHGDADPNAAWGPDPYILLGIGGATCTDIALKILTEVPDPAMRPGLNCLSFITNIGPSSNRILGRDTLGTRAFWEYASGGGLDKKLIYMEACRTAFHPGLAEALIGTDSIFLGWSEYVLVSASLTTADAVIRETVVDGFPVLRSFVHECGGGACIDGNTPPAELLAAWDRADLRTREALSIPATPIYAGCGVSPTEPLSITCPSCVGGFPMSMIFSISLDGVEPEEMVLLGDPLEFGKYQLRLFADIDDVESGYAQPLFDAVMLPAGNGTYFTFPMTLFMDNICPNQIIEYNPWVLLPTYDESMPGNDNRDRIYSWDGPFTIEVIPEQY